MIGWICFFLIASGTVYGFISGRGDAVAQSVLQSPSECVTLVINLCGSICFFSGLMRVAERAGIVRFLSRCLARPMGRLIPQSQKDPVARSSVTMNLASNFFGLGNAATPYGIQAAERMNSGRFTRSLGTFMILNTCSVQLIPASICALRQAGGAENPTDILPAVWVVQILSCLFGVLLMRVLFREAA